jgi:hypothetical protein
VLSVLGDEAGWQLRAIIGNTGFVNKDTGSFPLFVPDKFVVTLQNLLASQAAYNVRVRRQAGGRYHVTPVANPD